MTTKEFSEKWWGLIPDAEMAEWEADIKSLQAPTDLKTIVEIGQGSWFEGFNQADADWREKIEDAKQTYEDYAEGQYKQGAMDIVGKILEGKP